MGDEKLIPSTGLRRSRGVFKVQDDVFHFPKAEPNGLSDFHKPHLAVGHSAGGPSLARQEFKEECDINEIMARYETTGILPPTGAEPFYYDFTTLPTDLRGAMDVMREGGEAFMSLPAEVRRLFDNDPAWFVDYASNPEHLDQMRAWGLAAPEPAPSAPQGAPGASPVAPAASVPSPAPAAPAAPVAASAAPAQ